MLREVVKVLHPFADLISAAVVAAIIAGWVSLRTNARTIQVDNITKERAKWRDAVRGKALDVHRAVNGGDLAHLSELHLEFALILNPFDSEDRQILRRIREFASAEMTESGLAEFSDRISLLLKHDWQRAKAEVVFASWIRRLFVRRMKYESYKKKAVSTS